MHKTNNHFSLTIQVFFHNEGLIKPEKRQTKHNHTKDNIADAF